MLAVIAPGDLETSAKAEEVLDRVVMAVQAGSVARLALGDADNEAARPLDRRAGAAALVIGGGHHRIDAPRRDLFHRARRNAVYLEILVLVGRELAEAGNARLHLLGSQRLRSHGPLLFHQQACAI